MGRPRWSPRRTGAARRCCAVCATCDNRPRGRPRRVRLRGGSRRGARSGGEGCWRGRARRYVWSCCRGAEGSALQSWGDRLGCCGRQRDEGKELLVALGSAALSRSTESSVIQAESKATVGPQRALVVPLRESSAAESEPSSSVHRDRARECETARQRTELVHRSFWPDRVELGDADERESRGREQLARRPGLPALLTAQQRRTASRWTERAS